jgi:ribonuclease HII
MVETPDRKNKRAKNAKAKLAKGAKPGVKAPRVARLPLAEPVLRPSFSRERRAMARGILPVAGCDEAGRGPLAGPVVAAAVILDPARIPRGLNDSKKLDAATRENLYDKICATAHVSVAFGCTDRIDRDNILRASLWALARAVKALPVRPKLVFVDGNMKIDCDCDCEAVVSGDALVLSVAAASIVAKVTRDRMMTRLGLAHPGYGFERHMGYSVPEHFAALAKLGPTVHHRKSFAPVAAKLAALGAVSDEVIADVLPL